MISRQVLGGLNNSHYIDRLQYINRMEGFPADVKNFLGLFSKSSVGHEMAE